MTYKIKRIIDSKTVPDWERKPPKWTDLADDALKLEPGQAMEVEFDDAKAAKGARNAVRDTANLKAQAIEPGYIAVRTRLVVNPDGSATLYIMRTHVPITPTEPED